MRRIFGQLQLLDNRRFFSHFDITDHQTGEREREKFSSDHSLLTVSGAGSHVSTSNVEFHLSKGLVVEQSIHLCICICRMRWRLGCVRPSALERRRVCLTRYIYHCHGRHDQCSFWYYHLFGRQRKPPFFLFSFLFFFLFFGRGSV